MLIIHNYNLIIKKTNEKPIVIKKHSLLNDCYSIKDKSQLNGGEVKLEINSN